MTAPIALFAYKRPAELEQTLRALQANHLAQESELYVFVDGPKTEKDEPKVEQVRRLVHQITGFRKVHTFISDRNIGCASSIIQGVSRILEKHAAIIVVEDDIVTSPNFLDYMNQSLERYAADKQVFSVGGYTFPFRQPDEYLADGYFIGRHCAWGWAIWSDRWEQIDWKIQDYPQFIRDSRQRRAFNRAGNDLVRMLRKTMEGKLDAWDILVCYNIFKKGTYTLYPTRSKVENIGFYSNDGMNTNIFNRFKTELDTGSRRQFRFSERVEEHDFYARQFRRKYSLGVRVYNRLKTYMGFR